MSPARSKQQTSLPHKRDRNDIILAVAIAAGIVVFTLLLVWLLRPGPAGVPATGGLMNRQPRVSWLLGAAIGIAGLATWWILTRSSRRTRERAKVILPITLGIILVVSVLGGIFWPGGLLRHDVAPAAEPETPSTTVPSAATTTVPAAAATSTVPAATTTTPTTGAPTTTAANVSTTTTASP